MSATEPQVWQFQKLKFPSKELRDTYIRGFIAGLKAIGKEPIEFKEWLAVIENVHVAVGFNVLTMSMNKKSNRGLSENRTTLRNGMTTTSAPITQCLTAQGTDERFINITEVN